MNLELLAATQALRILDYKMALQWRIQITTTVININGSFSIPADRIDLPFIIVSEDLIPAQLNKVLPISIIRTWALADGTKVKAEWTIQPALVQEILSGKDKYSQKTNIQTFINDIKIGEAKVANAAGTKRFLLGDERSSLELSVLNKNSNLVEITGITCSTNLSSIYVST